VLNILVPASFGQLYATVGSNVSVTLEVRCSGPVDLLWSYNQFYSTGLTTSNVTFEHDYNKYYWSPTFKCSIRQEGNKIVATFYLTNVTLQLGGKYTLIPRDRGCSSASTVLTICGE
jgi:hypothetical protein